MIRLLTLSTVSSAKLEPETIFLELYLLILSHCYWWSLYQNILATFTSWVAYLREQLRQWWENNFLLSLFLLILQMVTRSYVVAVGNEIADLWLNSVIELSDNCSRLQGLLVFNAVGGVTGSCLGSMLFEHLSVNYVNKSKLGSTIYLSPRLLFQKKKNTLLITLKLESPQKIGLVYYLLISGTTVIDALQQCSLAAFSTLTKQSHKFVVTWIFIKDKKD